MWGCIIKRAIPSSFNKLGKSLQIRSSPHLIQCQFLGLTASSPESSLICYNSSHFTACAFSKFRFLSTSRFFSSNTFSENEEQSSCESPVPKADVWNLDSGSGCSIFEAQEQKDSVFGESLCSEGNNVDLDSKVDSFDSRYDLSENPSPESFDFSGGNQNFGNLLGNEGCTYLVANNDASLEIGSENSEESSLKYVEKLENLVSLLQSKGANGSLESSLEGISLLVNEEALLKVLDTPTIPRENLIGFFKWVVKRGQFSLTRKVVDGLAKFVTEGAGTRDVYDLSGDIIEKQLPVTWELVDGSMTLVWHDRTKDAYDLWDLVNDVGEKEIGVLSTEILNECICFFCNMGETKAAYEVFTKFETFGCVPDEDTYFWAISAVSQGSLFDLACSVCEKMLIEDKLPAGSEKIGKIISYLCRGNKVKDAYAVYMWASERNTFLFSDAVSDLISSLWDKQKTMIEEDKVSPEKKENIYWALEMLNDISKMQPELASKPFSSVTKGWRRRGDIAAAKDLFHKMLEKGPPPRHSAFKTMITALISAGDMEDAKKMVNIMEDRGLKPGIDIYSAILAGYVERGAMEDACNVLDEAKKKHKKKVSPYIYKILIHGYCKLKQFDMASKYMIESARFWVRPSDSKYESLVELLFLNAVDWKAAEGLMEEKGMKAVLEDIKEFAGEEFATEICRNRN